MMTPGKDIPSLDDVIAAHDRIRPHIHRTPVMTSRVLNSMAGAQLFFKCENLQKGGAFKARGACNAVFSLTEDEAERGVLTHSSGNHGLSLCYAAGRRGIRASVVMPYTAPKAKKYAVRAYRGRIVECEPTIGAREYAAELLQRQTGAIFVHPYNDPRVIAGQGTVTRELLEDVDDLDFVTAPIGGGGLISGACIAAGGLAPKVRIVAAEPAQADDAARSFREGRLIAYQAPVTVADGLKVPLKDLTWSIVSQRVDDILTATEDEIIAAMKLIWLHMKIVVEPSAAVPLAMLMRHGERFRGKRVGVILTGGNVDLDRLPWMR